MFHKNIFFFLYRSNTLQMVWSLVDMYTSNYDNTHYTTVVVPVLSTKWFVGFLYCHFKLHLSSLFYVGLLKFWSVFTEIVILQDQYNLFFLNYFTALHLSLIFNFIFSVKVSQTISMSIIQFFYNFWNSPVNCDCFAEIPFFNLNS